MSVGQFRNACEAACQSLPHRTEDRIAELRLTRAYLNPDQRYRGSCVLVVRHHVREITDLTSAEAEALWHDIRLVSAAVQMVVAPHKLNVALLGNLVPHLHAHIITRQSNDPAWPQAIWAVPLPPLAAEGTEKAGLIERLRAHL